MAAVVLAVAGAMALAMPVAAAEPVFEKYKVPTADGAEINVEVMRPAGRPAPVILTYSPYNTLSETTTPNLANDALGQYYVERGYARAVADVVGTRNSSGCWDYGGAREQQSGVDLVNYLAGRDWSNGKVAMIGGSYDGTTATMTAVRGADAPGLAAIVPIVGISRWYGYAYGDGVRYLGNSENPTDEGVDTPLAFDFGLVRTPPTDPADPLFAEKLASRGNPCDSLEHTEHGYDRSPDYGDFWLERDYRKDAGDIRAAVLVASGWQDYNVKQEEGVDLYRALPDGILKRLYMFQGPHQSPDADNWQPLLDRFFAHTLMGAENGIGDDPPVLTEGRSASEPTTGFRAEAAWPPPGTGDTPLFLGAGGTLAASPPQRALDGLIHRLRCGDGGALAERSRGRERLAALPQRPARARLADGRERPARAVARGRSRPRPSHAGPGRHRARRHGEDRLARLPQPGLPRRPHPWRARAGGRALPRDRDLQAAGPDVREGPPDRRAAAELERHLGGARRPGRGRDGPPRRPRPVPPRAAAGGVASEG